MSSKIQKDQKKFFNEYSEVEVNLVHPNPVLDAYINREQYEGFQWLSDQKYILDYGCGTGTSITRFFITNRKNKKSNHKFIGVDIAEKAVKKAKLKHPEYDFYAIEDNNLNQIKDETIDAAYIIHVLHHSTNHKEIFESIYKKLQPGGKLLINDLSSKNPLIRLGRHFFNLFPKYIQQKFSNDLIVNNNIPDKYPVDPHKTIKTLEDCNFKIIEFGQRHLFFFIFIWANNLLSIPNNKIINLFYKLMIKLENLIIKSKLFNKYIELFYIKAIKKDTYYD